MNYIDTSGLVGKQFRYKSRYGGVIYDTIQSAWVVYKADITTVKTDIPLTNLKDAIKGVKIGSKMYSKSESYCYPQIMIKSSKGVVYEFNDTITIKIL